MAESGARAYVGAADFGFGLAEVSLPQMKISAEIPGLLTTLLGLSANGTLLSISQSAYNTQNPSDTVTFYRVPGLTLIGTVALPSYIGAGLAADPLGRYAFTGYNDAVYQIDSQSLTVSKTIATGDVAALAISKKGSVLYPQLDPGSSIATFAEGASEPSHLSVLQETSTLTLSPDGQVLYITPEFPDGGIVPISTASGIKLGTFLPNNLVTSMAMSSDGSTLFSVAESILDGPPWELIVLNAQTGAVKATVPLPGSPGQLAVAPDESKVVVNVVTGPVIYDVATGTVTTVAMTGAYACAIYGTGNPAYLQSEEGDVKEVDLKTAKVLGTIGVFGGAIAFSPTETAAFASGLNGDIAVIDTTTGNITSTISTNVVYPQAMGVYSRWTISLCDRLGGRNERRRGH